MDVGFLVYYTGTFRLMFKQTTQFLFRFSKLKKKYNIYTSFNSIHFINKIIFYIFLYYWLFSIDPFTVYEILTNKQTYTEIFIVYDKY